MALLLLGREKSDICEVRHLLLNLKVSLNSIFHCYYLGKGRLTFTLFFVFIVIFQFSKLYGFLCNIKISYLILIEIMYCFD